MKTLAIAILVVAAAAAPAADFSPTDPKRPWHLPTPTPTPTGTFAPSDPAKPLPKVPLCRAPVSPAVPHDTLMAGRRAVATAAEEAEPRWTIVSEGPPDEWYTIPVGELGETPEDGGDMHVESS